MKSAPTGGWGTAQHGFTIVEVAFAAVMLALAFTTSFAAMQRALLDLDTARNLEIATGIMQCELERERLFSWTQVSDGTYQPAIDPSFMRNTAVAGRFTLARNVSVLPARNGQMVQVTLMVRWRTHDGRTLARSHTTYFCQGGLYNYIYQGA